MDESILFNLRTYSQKVLGNKVWLVERSPLSTSLLFLSPGTLRVMCVYIDMGRVLSRQLFLSNTPL